MYEGIGKGPIEDHVPITLAKLLYVCYLHLCSIALGIPVVIALRQGKLS